jgi:hypothetical protein
MEPVKLKPETLQLPAMAEIEMEEPPEPDPLFHSNIAEYWQSIVQHSPSGDESSSEIWFSIKWSLSINITSNSHYADSVTITGKYNFDESWTEGFATVKNAERWKKNVQENIREVASQHYKVKIDIAGSKRTGQKGDGIIIVTLTWSPSRA